eukprot:2526995-Rhodomonas_salina.2
MVMRSPRPRLKIRPPREPRATPAPLPQDLQNPVPPSQTPFPSDSDMIDWIRAIERSGAEWSCYTPCYGTTRCTA